MVQIVSSQLHNAYYLEQAPWFSCFTRVPLFVIFTKVISPAVYTYSLWFSIKSCIYLRPTPWKTGIQWFTAFVGTFLNCFLGTVTENGSLRTSLPKIMVVCLCIHCSGKESEDEEEEEKWRTRGDERISIEEENGNCPFFLLPPPIFFHFAPSQ